jgi:hypothetical protein
MEKDYPSWSKGKLIQRFLELESILDRNLDSKNEEFLVEFPWAGNLGNGIFSIKKIE